MLPHNSLKKGFPNKTLISTRFTDVTGVPPLCVEFQGEKSQRSDEGEGDNGVGPSDEICPGVEEEKAGAFAESREGHEISPKCGPPFGKVVPGGRVVGTVEGPVVAGLSDEFRVAAEFGRGKRFVGPSVTNGEKGYESRIQGQGQGRRLVPSANQGVHRHGRLWALKGWRGWPL